MVTNGTTSLNGCITTLTQDILVSTSQPTIYGEDCDNVLNIGTGRGVVGHTISSATPANPISLRTLTGTTSCSGGVIGVYGTTNLTTLYTNSFPGFGPGATVYTSSTFNSSTLVPNGFPYFSPFSKSFRSEFDQEELNRSSVEPINSFFSAFLSFNLIRTVSFLTSLDSSPIRI